MFASDIRQPYRRRRCDKCHWPQHHTTRRGPRPRGGGQAKGSTTPPLGSVSSCSGRRVATAACRGKITRRRPGLMPWQPQGGTPPAGGGGGCRLNRVLAARNCVKWPPRVRVTSFIGPNTNEKLAVNSVARLNSAANAICQVAEPAFPLISGAHDGPGGVAASTLFRHGGRRAPLRARCLGTERRSRQPLASFWPAVALGPERHSLGLWCPHRFVNQP
jgi:hypothetical protein